MLDYRYVARLTIEAETPLAVGTGEQGILCDDLVATDVNGLPFIPGSALCGVLRHALENAGWEKNKDENGYSLTENIFGYQRQTKDKKGDTDGKGSRIIISDAIMLDSSGKALDGMRRIDWKDKYLSRFKALPIRQHCRINHRGAADTEKYGKFDNQVVYKGTRFVLELELAGNENDKQYWTELVNQFKSPLFRIGGGTRKGYGKLKIEKCQARTFDLKSELDTYLDKSSSMSDDFPGAEDVKLEVATFGWNTYMLSLEPDDFFLFGSGFGDEEADMTPVSEAIIEWAPGGNECQFSDEKVLIPASSVKGAIAHRTAFHYNKLAGNFADGKNAEQLKELCGENNPAVKTLFGSAKNSKDKHSAGQIGRVILSDMFEKGKTEKILNHVSIDRFTGGAIDGALFNEKVTTGIEKKIQLEILVDTAAFEVEDGDKIKQAFECALKDICTGMLPLGGGVMRGHGCFKGKLIVNGAEAER